MHRRCPGVLVFALLVLWCTVFPCRQCTAITGSWKEQDSGVEAELFGLCFVGRYEGWVVGAEGMVLHTTDGGETWVRQESGTTEDLYSVAFGTKEEGWAVGHYVVLHTTNGGRTWTTLPSWDERYMGEFYDIALVDPLNGWVGVDKGCILPLRNGAISVEGRRLLRWIDMTDVDFLNADVGWCAGGRRSATGGGVYRTTNGGTNWAYKSFDVPMRAIHFIDEEEGWAVGDDGALFRSLDGGASWEGQESGTDIVDLRDVFFVDDREGWAVGKGGLILKTFTAGGLWYRRIWNHPILAPETPDPGYRNFYPDLNRVLFVNPLEGWIVGERGIILHFAGQYETIPAFLEMTDVEPTLRVRRGSFALGKGGYRWGTSGTRSNLAIRNDALVPSRVRSQADLIRQVWSAGEGAIWSTAPAAFETSVTYLIDEERVIDETVIPTLYESWEISGSVTVYVDLGVRYPVYLIMLKLARIPDPRFLLPQHLEIGLNDGDPRDLDQRGRPLLHPIWSQDIDGYTPLRIEIPPQSARYIGIKVSDTEKLRLQDLEVFGDGYFAHSSFLSKPIDFGARSAWGRLRWEGERPPGTEVILRTRIGEDDDPNVYWRRIGESETYTNRTESGRPLTRHDYQALSRSKRGEITFDSAHWTPWSARYPFGDGEAPVQSRDARRYLQIQVEFDNDVDAAGTLSHLSVEASNPPSADLALGEMLPSHAAPARITAFTYAIRSRFKKGDLGFDSVEIHTPVRPVAIRRVMIDSTEVGFRSEIRDDPVGFVVHFRELGFPRDNTLVLISFDCAVFRYGSGFPGYILNSRYEEAFPQQVVAGDAVKGIGDDVLTVQTKLETPLILQPDADPSPFTPNGDGVNDETTLSYTIVKLFALAPVRVEVYNLAGRLVCPVYEGVERDGVHLHRWDGRDGDGRLVPPGIYLYRIELDAEVGRQSVAGIVHVAY